MPAAGSASRTTTGASRAGASSARRRRRRDGSIGCRHVQFWREHTKSAWASNSSGSNTVARVRRRSRACATNRKSDSYVVSGAGGEPSAVCRDATRPRDVYIFDTPRLFLTRRVQAGTRNLPYYGLSPRAWVEQRSRVPIQIQRDVLMPAEDRGGDQRGDFAFESRFDGRRLPALRHDAHDFTGPEDLAH